MILMFKPFKVGDFIEAQGHSGTVKSIQIFVTTLTTPDNKLIILPNGALSNGSLVNYSAQEFRRLNGLGIGYDADLDKAKSILHNLINGDTRIIKDKPILVEWLSGSSVNIITRAWVKSNYWDVHYAMNEGI